MKPKITVFHNLPTGGAKRTLFENLKGLKNDFDFYLYDLKGPHDDFLNVRPLCKKVFTYDFKETPLLPRPCGFLNSLCRLYDLAKLNNLHKKIAQLIDKENYSLVFVFADRLSQTPFILRHLKTKSLYYCHDPYIRSVYEPEIERKNKKLSFKERLKIIFYWSAKFLYQKILAWQDKINTKKATKVIICSKYAAKKMKDKYDVYAEVVYPGVDIESFRPLDIKKDNAVISQGAVLFRKGHQFIIESLGKIEKRLRPKLYILADSGREDEEFFLLDLAEKLDLEVKIFKGVNDEEIVKIYNQALLCLCGQINEPFNLSVLEANACGIPVVSVDEGGMKETVIDKVNGYLVERNRQVFAAKIKELLENKEKMEEMGKRGREYMIKNFNWQVCNQKLKKIIEKIIKLENTHFSTVRG